MKIRILRAALKDLESSRSFYDKQGEGVGDYFYDSLFSDIDSLTLYAGVHKRYDRFYRMLSRRFPFAIYYTLEGNTVLVWRILDLRQHPDSIKTKLK